VTFSGRSERYSNVFLTFGPGLVKGTEASIIRFRLVRTT